MCFSSFTSIWDSYEVQRDADDQADQLKEDAKQEREAAAKRVVRIKRAGEAQQSQAISDTASSGLSVNSQTALTAAKSIADRIEEDAAEELLYGSRRALRLEEGARRTQKLSRRRARNMQASAFSVGSLLSSGSSSGSGWSGGQTGGDYRTDE